MYRPYKFWGTQADWGNPIGGREGVVHACVCVCMCLRFSDFVRACVRALCRVFGFFDDFLVCFVKKCIMWQDRPFLYNCVCMCSRQPIGPALCGISQDFIHVRGSRMIEIS